MAAIQPNQLVYAIDVGSGYVADIPLNPMPAASSVVDTITPDTDRNVILRLALEYYKRKRADDAKVLFDMCRVQKGDLKSEQNYKLVELAIQLVQFQRRTDWKEGERQSVLNSLSNEIQDASRLDPESLNVHIIHGIIDLERRDYKGAVLRLRNVMDHDKSHLPGIVTRATVHMRNGEWNMALKFWQDALSQVSGNELIPLEVQCQVRIGIGYCYAHLELFDYAIVAFQRVIQMDPDNVEAHFYKASICLNLVRRQDTLKSDRRPYLQEGTQAIQLAHRAMKKSKCVHAPVCARLADVLFSQHDHIRSSKVIETGLPVAHDPAIKSELHFYRGRALHKSGDFDGAFTEYLKAVKGNQDLLPAKYALAQMYVHQSELSSALPLLESIREKVRSRVDIAAKAEDASKGPGTAFGDDYDSLKLLAIVHATLAEAPILSSTTMPTKDYNQARERSRDMYQRALELFKLLYSFDSREHEECGARDLVALITHARMLETSPHGTMESRISAIELYKRAEAVFNNKNPGKTVPPELTNNMGVLLHMQRKFDEAQAAYVRAFTDAKELPLSVRNAIRIPLQYNTGRAYEEAGNIDDAVKYYHQVVKKNPKYVDAHLRLALIDQELGNMDGAAAHVKNAVDNVGDSVEARIVFGTLLRTTGMIRQARKCFSENLQYHDKFDLVSLLQLGNILLFDARPAAGTSVSEAKAERLKQLGDAYKLFEKVIQLDYRNPYAANGLAIALHECGFVDDAVRIFEQCREADDSVPCFSLNYAHALAETGEYRRAIALFEKAQDRFFNNLNTELMVATAHAYLRLGKQIRSAENVRSALRLLQQAARLVPSDILVWLNLLITLQDHTATMASERVERVAIEDMQSAATLASLALRQLRYLETTTFRSATEEFDQNVIKQRANFTSQERDRIEGKIEQMNMAQKERAEQIHAMAERAALKKREQLEMEASVNEAKRAELDQYSREWEMQKQRLEGNIQWFEECRIREEERRAAAAGSKSGGRKRNQDDADPFIVPDAHVELGESFSEQQLKRRKHDHELYEGADTDPVGSGERRKRKGENEPRSSEFIENSDDELVGSDTNDTMDVDP